MAFYNFKFKSFKRIHRQPYKIILPTASQYQKRNLHCSLTQKKLLRKKWQDVESWVYHFDTGSIFLGLNPLFMAHKLVKNYKEMVKIAITMMYLGSTA